MKKMIIILIAFFITGTTHAQLANSSWKGTLNLDSPLNTFFNFSSDTLEVLNQEDNSNLETMKYTITDSVLTLQKLYGQSQCGGDIIGMYKCKITNDHLFLNVISDSCDGRKYAIGTMELSKVK
jgi:hypothetical protein